MIGYKLAMSGFNRVLITLEIPEDAKTNLNRSNIMCREYAQYRCDKAKVICIEDGWGNKYGVAHTKFINKLFEYELGKMVVEPSYNQDIELVCVEGIHFFLNKEVALNYVYQIIGSIQNGEYKRWHYNGQIYIITTYVNGEAQGEYIQHYDNGQVQVKTTYKDGKIDGRYERWWSNGFLKSQANYVNGKLIGEAKRWHDNGKIKSLTFYVNDKGQGEFKEWFRDGTLKSVAIYENGKAQGEYKEWYDNGQIKIVANYVDGKLNGMHKEWYEDGDLRLITNYINGKEEVKHRFIDKLVLWYAKKMI